MKNVPIYTADISLNRISKKGRNEKILDKVEIKNVVVKGFSIKDIKKRSLKRIISKAINVKKLGDDQRYQVFNVSLLKFHGYGIND